MNLFARIPSLRVAPFSEIARIKQKQKLYNREETWNDNGLGINYIEMPSIRRWIKWNQKDMSHHQCLKFSFLYATNNG